MRRFSQASAVIRIRASSALAFCPLGRYSHWIAIASKKSIHVADVAPDQGPSGAILGTFELPELVSSITWLASSSEPCLIAACADGLVRRIRISPQQDNTVIIQSQHVSPPLLAGLEESAMPSVLPRTSAATPDWVVPVCYDTEFVAWDWRTWREESQNSDADVAADDSSAPCLRKPLHAHRINSCMWDGNPIVSGSEDGSIIVWNVSWQSNGMAAVSMRSVASWSVAHPVTRILLVPREVPLEPAQEESNSDTVGPPDDVVPAAVVVCVSPSTLAGESGGEREATSVADDAAIHVWQLSRTNTGEVEGRRNRVLNVHQGAVRVRPW